MHNVGGNLAAMIFREMVSGMVFLYFNVAVSHDARHVDAV
jgi:hypothetical protein